MGIFKNIFSRKKTASELGLEVAATENAGYLGEAEHISNIVSAGLEKGDLSGMNARLASVAKEHDKKVYVFEHPGVIKKYYAVAVCFGFALLFAYYLFIGVSTTIMSSKFRQMGLMYTVMSTVGLITNIWLILRFIAVIRYKARFDIYEELLCCRNMMYIDDIAACTKHKEPLIIKDLQKSVKSRLIPQGHLSRENHVFMVSNEVYERYMEKPAVYDRYFQKELEERQRISSRPAKVRKVLESGQEYIGKIHGYGTLVKDKNLSRKIGRVENIVSMIFHEIDMHPNQVQSLGVFLNYYLPTTEKLLDAYVSMDEKKESGKTPARMRKEIEDAINSIMNAFENILEKMYEERELELSSDIEALELSLKQDSLIE